MQIEQLRAEEALGILNEVEQKNAPEMLFLRGDAELLKYPGKVSIVGSRKASDLGLKRAARLAKMLTSDDIVVVSGLAEGIDTAAHSAAIKNGGKTISVIGTPQDKFYPASNRELQEQIAREHLLVSQFPVGYPGGRKNFPMRNRTMALISDATVIIEAQDKSGTLHQGYEALRLGRPLYIAKACADQPGLEWTKELISYGAKILTEDSYQELTDYLPRVTRDELQAFAI